MARIVNQEWIGFDPETGESWVKSEVVFIDGSTGTVYMPTTEKKTGTEVRGFAQLTPPKGLVGAKE